MGLTVSRGPQAPWPTESLRVPGQWPRRPEGHGGLARAVARAVAQASLRCPTDVLERFRELCPSELPGTAALHGRAGGPGAFDEGTAGLGGAGCGDGSLLAALPTGIRGREQAQLLPPWPRRLAARQVAECCHHGHSHGTLPPRRRLVGADRERARSHRGQLQRHRRGVWPSMGACG